MKRHLLFGLNNLLVLGCLLGLWQLVVSVLHVPAYMLPGPMAVGAAVVHRFPSLLQSLLLTSTAAALGLAGSVVIGVAIALGFAQWSWLRRLLFPYTILLQTVPIVAIAPLILMWAGSGVTSVALVAFIICLPPIIANTTQGLISVEENFVHLFLMHHATAMQVLFKLRLPHALPNLFVGMRISAGISVIGAITGELFAGSSRVGQGAGLFDIVREWAIGDGLFVCAGVGGDGAGVRFLFCGNVSGVVFFASLA